MTPTLETLLPESAAINNTAPDTAARLDLTTIPAKGAVYLLLDPTGTPMLLATVRNLRAALERRLTDTPTDQKSSRLQYGQLCTTLRYRVVNSPFAANFHYLQTARMLFPKTYPAMVTWRPSWFIGIDQQASFPQFRKTAALDNPDLTCFGPIPDKHAAGRLVEALDDIFDLCRYQTILIQAPQGKACAYKEMGKCPAPCDGTVPIEHYHQQIAAAASILPRGGYAAWRLSLEEQMKSAAARLEFERAARIKSRLTAGTILEQRAFTQMDALTRFVFLSLQPGPGTSWVQPFFIHSGTIDEGEPVKRKDLPAAAARWLKKLTTLAAKPVQTPLSKAEAEQIALVAFHLFRGEEDAGIYLHASAVESADTILTAAESLLSGRNAAKPLADQSSDRQQEAEPVLPEQTPSVGPDPKMPIEK